MRKFHILNGDCLLEQIKTTSIDDSFIICRECLINGEVKAQDLRDFWEIRASHIADTYHVSKDEYFTKTVSQFNQILNLPEGSEVCLWFENDLFCQVNMWFCLSLLTHRSDLKIFRIFPIVDNQKDIWKGFAMVDSLSLEQSYTGKTIFQKHDIELGVNLWKAYQENDFRELKELSKIDSTCFQYLEEIIQAHIERFPSGNALSRPERVIQEIMKNDTTDFYSVFTLFSEREGVYGFGDLQLKPIYDRFMKLKD
ncbi:uncharacterized protein DUF1835 [Arcicella aurantiaca]|uniref:Uncharacterized protein DUF1835 n=1 Tax=Arcicella aurantiaca TaxID=591202 RepID=A0A316DQN6_9BACT|nr:DUF1835 domain-containing protein [Arcicella aurantiaca]PWK20275.1 uncharacterized protein DUF1835 [Arcicella aurantiaca]